MQLIPTLKNPKLWRLARQLCVIGSLSAAGLLHISSVSAEDDEYAEPTYVKRSFDYEMLNGVVSRLEPLGDGMFGDRADKQTGTFSIYHSDVTIPGNSNLEVALHRKIVTGAKYHSAFQQGFGNWTLDLPIAYFAYGVNNNTNNPTFNGGCLVNLGNINRDISRTNSLGAQSHFSSDAHMDGKILYVPNKGLSGFPSQAYSTTAGLSDPKSNWVSGGRGTDHNGNCAEIVIGSDGTKYKFGKHTFRKAKDMTAPAYWSRTYSGGHYQQGYSWLSLGRRYAVYLITEIEDVHGNYVRYEYTNGDELQRIVSNDGRQIAITYSSATVAGRNSRLISSIDVNGRTWRYQYSGNVLTKVTLPDNRYWQFGVGTGLDQTRPMIAMDYETWLHYNCAPVDRAFSIKHPDGAIGKFTLAETKQLTSTVHKDVGPDEHLRLGPTWRFPTSPTTPNYETDLNKCRSGYTEVGEEPLEGDPYYRVMSLVEKTISGSDIPTSTWSFEYGGHPGEPKTHYFSKITTPDNTVKTYTYHTYGTDHGLLHTIDIRDSLGNTHKTEYEYELSQGVPAGCDAGGEYGDATGSCLNFSKRPKTKIKRTVNSETYTIEQRFDKAGNGKFVDYGLPNRIIRYSTLQSPQRITDLDYWHNTGANIIGLTSRVVKNNKEFYRMVYNTKGLATDVNKLGANYEDYTYHSDGNLKSAKDALNNTATFSSYYRGVPRTITRRDGKVLRRTVDANGWITSETDARGTRFGYSYNKVGWMTRVDRPHPWSDTSVSYHNLGKSSFYSKEIRSSKENITWYDMRLRPTLTRERATSAGGSTTYQKTQYDNMGRTTFNSFPSTSSNPTLGKSNNYDGLGRITRVTENATPTATTRYEYLSDNRTRVTDPRGYQTTTYRSGYGSPFDGDVTRIYSPEDVTTRMTYDIYGNMLSLMQFHEYDSEIGTQRWSYDSRLRTCRHYVPETGSKLFQYDNADRVIAYAEGVGGTSGCASLPTSSKVILSYDKLGRNTRVNYPSGTSDIVRTFDANGNMLTNYRGGVNWTYTYNNLNLPTSEKLDVDGRNYDLAYTYSNEEELLTRRLPSGRTLSYGYNGLFQQTSVRHGSTTYANNAAYHPTGSLTRLRFGNGLSVYRSFYTKGLQRTMLVENDDGELYLDYFYRYDASGNMIESVYDDEGVMTYDGLNRLKTASGDWGNGYYYYDALGNILRKRLGNRTVRNGYDDDNRIISSNDTVNGSRSFRYDNRGNIIQAGNLSFVYDAANQPVSLSGAKSGSYRYDGNLKRVKAVAGGKTIYNVFDISGRLVHVDKATVNQKTDYIHTAGETIARVTNNVITYLHNDYLGSPIMGTKQNGTFAFSQKFTPYGENYNGNTANDDLGSYTGHIRDSETGLTYMQARYYDPVIGRFYSNDPVDVLGHMSRGDLVHGFNRYGYAANNPYKYTDPDGELFWGAIIGAGVELIAQVATGQEINLTDVAIAGAVGAVTGGFAGRAATQAIKGTITGAKATAQTTIVSGAANGAGSVVSDVVQGKDIDVTKAVTSTVAGAAGGLGGSKAANSITNKLDNMSDAGGISSQISNTTRSSYVGSNVSEQLTSGSSTAAAAAGEVAASIANKEFNENN